MAVLGTVRRQHAWAIPPKQDSGMRAICALLTQVALTSVILAAAPCFTRCSCRQCCFAAQAQQLATFSAQQLVASIVAPLSVAAALSQCAGVVSSIVCSSKARLVETRLTGNEFLKCCNSWSVVVEGTSSPRLLPTVTRPTKRQPAMEVWITGTWSANSDSKILRMECDEAIQPSCMLSL